MVAQVHSVTVHSYQRCFIPITVALMVSNRVCNMCHTYHVALLYEQTFVVKIC
jgi:hypothetical protein